MMDIWKENQWVETMKTVQKNVETTKLRNICILFNLNCKQWEGITGNIRNKVSMQEKLPKIYSFCNECIRFVTSQYI